MAAIKQTRFYLCINVRYEEITVMKENEVIRSAPKGRVQGTRINNKT